MADASAVRPAALDPDVKRFVDSVAAAYRQHPAPQSLAARRALADQIRAPWAQGGPGMARTLELNASHGGQSVRVRLYDPEGVGPKPALIYLHGGGWTIFGLESHDRLMREYASAAGCVVIGVDYALSPEAKFPIALEQCAASVRWLAMNAAQLGVAAQSMAIGGDSAGGNLALATALVLRDTGEDALLRGVLINYGALDDEFSIDARTFYGGPGNMLEADEMMAFWGNYLAPGDRLNPLARPILADLAGLPPVFLAIAECDLLAEQNQRLAARLEAAGVAVRAQVYRGAAHSFLESMSISALARRAISDGAEWLKQRWVQADGGKVAHSRA